VSENLTKRLYVSNKEMCAALVEHKKRHVKALKEGLEPPQIPDTIGKMIWLICERLSTRWNFSGYTYRDEMVADGIENCVAAVLKFNHKKSENAHAYFTLVAWRAFIRRIGKEQKQHAIKHKNLENMQILMEELLPGSNTAATDSSQSDGVRRHYEVIEKYEEKLLKKKKPLTSAPAKAKKKTSKGVTKNAKKRSAAAGRKGPVRKAKRPARV
jgi:hypothetical protein